MIHVCAIKRGRQLSQAVSAQLAAAIRDGQIALGERLPPERELAERFGVSRVVVREAMSRLKSEGLVETRQGAGAFVTSDAERSPFRIEVLDRAGLKELFDLRLAIEGKAAALAARHARRAERDAIAAALAALRADVAAGRDGVEADAAFHRAIAVAGRNRYLSRFVVFVDAHLRSAITAARTNTARHHEARIAAVQQEHEAILEAILARAPAAAEAAMTLHLSNAAERLGLTHVRAGRGAEGA